jgi:hypothetical protein
MALSSMNAYGIDVYILSIFLILITRYRSSPLVVVLVAAIIAIIPSFLFLSQNSQTLLTLQGLESSVEGLESSVEGLHQQLQTQAHLASYRSGI